LVGVESLKHADRRQFPHRGVAFDVEPFDQLEHVRELGGVTGIKLECQVPAEIGHVQVKQTVCTVKVAVLGPGARERG